MTSATEPTHTFNQNSYDDLKLLSDTTRHTFLWIYIIITTLSLFGNCAAVYSIVRRNYRTFQKTCIVSLALSDILATIAIFLINMMSFIKDIKYWPLGSFLCSFLPMCQMTGILASSVALTFIAMDRYRNVVFALTNRWNPQLSFCLVVTAVFWLASFGVSYPIYTFYELKMFPVDDDLIPCCVLWNTSKESLRNYYIYMCVLIFLPLFVVFIWFYYNIASIVWRHRKPLSKIFNKTTPEENTSSTTKTYPETKNLNKPKTQEDIRVEKKIRTFKIIIALMVVFIVCRLPYFVIQILKTVDSVLADSDEMWDLIFIFMALHIVNCMMNPLLYTFLNLTLKVWFKIENFVLEVCCFCCSSSEFESFERENPFVVDNYDVKRNSKVRFEDDGRH